MISTYCWTLSQVCLNKIVMQITSGRVEDMIILDRIVDNDSFKEEISKIK